MARESRSTAEFIEFVENGARFRVQGPSGPGGGGGSLVNGVEMWLNVRLPHSGLETGMAPCEVVSSEGGTIEVVFRNHSNESGPVIVASLFK